MENSFLKKLKVKPGSIVNIIDAPEGSAGIFGNVPADIIFKYDADTTFDILITFSVNQAQLHEQIQQKLKNIDAKTIFWVFYPKKSSKITSDLDLMKSWEELHTFGLTPCASAAVNEIWTALRLKLIDQVKPSGMRNDHIKNNEYGEYIDPVNKTVKIPDDLKTTLENHSDALTFFNGLSYSNRKEYVLWLLSAKQDKTRLARLEKTVEMLLKRKKNPTDK